MKIFYDTNLMSFEFWSGARDFADQLTAEQFETIEREIEEQHPDGIGATELNDLFWFEQDYLKELLGVAWPVLLDVETHLGNHYTVSVDDDYEKEDVFSNCDGDDLVCQEIGSAFENPDEEADVEWNRFDVSNTLWEEDSNRFIRRVIVPMSWAAIIENDDFTGVDDEEEAAIREFMEKELANADEMHIWDTWNYTFETPDYYGEDGDADCIAIRFYKKA